jgi:hypothetical protein
MVIQSSVTTKVSIVPLLSVRVVRNYKAEYEINSAIIYHNPVNPLLTPVPTSLTVFSVPILSYLVLSHPVPSNPIIFYPISS